ncbi:MAG: TIGR00266 family protein [Mollicutes bacterium]|nr:TIGR00266 family protein [Mollicutes bacterium]
MKYEIKGDNLPVVIVHLNQNESIVSEAGAMSWHTEGINVNTKGRGGLGKMIGRGFSGETMFQNIYTAQSDNQQIAFASSFPGSIVKVDISNGNELIVQKRSFLASSINVNTEIFFQKKLGAGLFGGEGFIMQKLIGEGIAFLEVDGSFHAYTLDANEKMIIDTGYLVAMDSTCSMDIQSAGNLKSMLLGGEGLFNTVIKGPGKIYLQSMPLAKLRSLFYPTNK